MKASSTTPSLRSWSGTKPTPTTDVMRQVEDMLAHIARRLTGDAITYRGHEIDLAAMAALRCYRDHRIR